MVAAFNAVHVMVVSGGGCVSCIMDRMLIDFKAVTIRLFIYS